MENTEKNPIARKVFEVGGAKIQIECLVARDVEPSFPFEKLDSYDFVIASVEEGGNKEKLWWSDLEKRPWYKDFVKAFEESDEVAKLKTATARDMIEWWFLPEPS